MSSPPITGGPPPPGTYMPLMAYVYPLWHYDGLIGRLPGNIDHVVLCGGTHYQHDGTWPRSWEYINAVGHYFVEKGFSVEARMAQNPDDDVIFMSHAAHFFQGGGGFSKLIGGIARNMGARVYE